MSSSSPSRRKVVIVDDQPLWSMGLSSLLEDASIDVVGEARTAEEALAIVDEHEPDLLVADARLNGGASGVACVREAIRRHPEIRAVVISAFDDAASIEEALASGADAFVSRKAEPDDVIAAIRQTFNHSVFLAGPSYHGGRRSGGPRLPGLTPRETEILGLIAEGYSNGKVAQTLWVTEQTVKFHLSNIYRKLGVANRTEATRWALEAHQRAGSPESHEPSDESSAPDGVDGSEDDKRPPSGP
jgi:DNA-binding NarL/FixJ family response regulator